MQFQKFFLDISNTIRGRHWDLDGISHCIYLGQSMALAFMGLAGFFVGYWAIPRKGDYSTTTIHEGFGCIGLTLFEHGVRRADTTTMVLVIYKGSSG